MEKNSRRDFIKKSSAATAALSIGGVLPAFSASSYSRIVGSNEKLNVSLMGVNSRGKVLAINFAQQQGCDVLHICDVDSRAIQKCQKEVDLHQNFKTKGFKDFRKSLEDKNS